MLRWRTALVRFIWSSFGRRVKFFLRDGPTARVPVADRPTKFYHEPIASHELRPKRGRASRSLRRYSVD